MITKITKAELVDIVREASPLLRGDVERTINVLLVSMVNSILAGKTIELRGFGTFSLKLRNGRKKARNPRTDEIVSVPPYYTVSFKPGTKLKAEAKKIDPALFSSKYDD